MATGGGVYIPPSKVDDGDVDIAPFVDIEIKGAIHSDIVIGKNSTTEYIVGSDNVLIVDNRNDTETENVQIDGPQTSRPSVNERRTHYSRGTAIDKELHARLEGVAELRLQERELHESRMRQEVMKEEEAQVRLEIAKLELELLKKKLNFINFMSQNDFE
ncbi:hypothetical protein FQR65_LT19032 [Abscondita terminalis]|nr:hypothetical protein FQR65_LT19032 [Abscondita terminalis]